MASEDRISVMQIEAETSQFTENQEKPEKVKKPRVRRTKAEINAAKKQENSIERAKLEKRLAQLDAEDKLLDLTPEQRKAEKKKTEDNCKFFAGVTAFELAKKGKSFFNIENFRKRLYAELNDPLEINFLNRMFKGDINK